MNDPGTVFMMRARTVVLLLLCLLASSGAKSQLDGTFHDVTAYGAVRDTQTVSTAAIQAAIDSCYRQGGGTVHFPPGDYCSGTIVLKDNVTLYLETGATLYASRNIDDYRMPLEDAPRPILIYANGARNIRIMGHGTISGRARHVYEDLRSVDRFIKDITENARQAGIEMKRYYIVPPDVGLVVLSKCEGISIENVSLVESSFWTLHLVRSERIFIRGVYIFSDLEKGVNADGIDINSCKDVMITDCNVTTGDDAIVVKSWYTKPCENVTVSNCILSSSSTALKLGTESNGDFKHIQFSNCVVRNSNRGLSIVVRSGARVENVLFSDITVECKRRHFNWWGNADPIWVYLDRRNANVKAGYIKDVVFSNIIAHGMGTSKIECLEGTRIENLQLNNVQLYMQAEDKADKRADHALEVSHVKDLRLQDVSIRWSSEQTEPKWKSALSFSNVDGLIIDRFSGSQGLADGDDPVIELIDVSNALITACTPDCNTSTLVRVTGERSQNILLKDNDPFQKAEVELQVVDVGKTSSNIKALD